VTEGSQRPVKIDESIPHSARLWNYWLGGKDNFAVDRQAGDQVLALVPQLVASARADRAFLGRAVKYLAVEHGVRQFLDIGTGIPTANNTHEVAQAVAPDARIVYVDNDPMVLVHARALLTSTPEGATDYIDVDLREPDRIIRAAARTLDFERPIAIMLLGIVNFVVDDDQAHTIVNRLIDEVPSGSFLVMSHPTLGKEPEAAEQALQLWNNTGAAQMTLRTPQQLVSFFDRLALVDPGVVTCSQWRPDSTGTPDAVLHFGAVGRKP
jgi:O-methyltransferase involved in polyketide biosynthesis